MNYTELLQIYDADDWLTRGTGYMRPAHKTVGITGGVQGLMKVFDQFVAEKRVFGRVVFHTHGNDGYIAFGNEAVTTHVLKNRFAGRSYETLFAYHARVYFNGCRVAAGDVGWKFLETAGSVLLGRMGGTTFGHTKDGRPLLIHAAAVYGGLAGAVLFREKIGRSFHINGETRYVYTSPGALSVRRWTD